jgi:protein CpxP
MEPCQATEDRKLMNKTLCSIALTGLLTFGIAGTALAQDNSGQEPAAPPPGQNQGMQGPRRMDPDRQLQHMTKELNLSADQQAQIKPILTDTDQKMQALWQDQSLSQQDRRAKMRAIHEDSRAKIEAVLNDEQKPKFEAMQQHMRRGQGGPPPQDAPPPQQN